MEHTGSLVCSFKSAEDAVNSLAAVQKVGITPLAVEFMERHLATGTAEKMSKTWPMNDEGTIDIIYMVEEGSEDALYETAGTLNDSWGYCAWDRNWKSPEQLLANKRRLNSFGVNYLLNVGPDALGRFPADAQAILHAYADLLAKE